MGGREKSGKIWRRVIYYMVDDRYVGKGRKLMSKAESARKLYEECKDMDIEETMELVLNAETEEEQDFFSMLSDFILQRKQKDVIAQKRF